LWRSLHRTTAASTGAGAVHTRSPVRTSQAQELDEKVVAGSFNYTKVANEINDENIFVPGSVFSEVEGVEVGASPSRALAKHMKAEIERIIANNKKFTPT
jgi:hypothetical protein